MTGTDTDAAIARLRRQAQRAPGDANTMHNLAVLLFRNGQADQALYFEERAARMRPGVGDFHATLGTILAMAGRRAEAIDAIRHAIAVEPHRASHHLAFVPLLWERGEHEAVLASAQAAFDLDPAAARAPLSSVLLNIGEADRAIGVLRAGLAITPDDPWLLSSLASTLNYVDGPAHEISDVLRRAGLSLAARALPLPPPLGAGPPDPNRRLRVGLLSSDLYDHSVAAFLEPILVHHDRAALEIHALSSRSLSTADAVTQRLRASCRAWHDLSMADHESLARRVHALNLDIIVDLAGHTAPTLLLGLASRLAPFQFTYLGYPNTTGIPAMDARLVDAVTDPPGSDHLATERLIRLPGCFLCYQPPADAPEPTQRPAGRALRFGSFNNCSKLTPKMLAAWAAILLAVPGSVLVLKSRQFSSPMVRRTILDRLCTSGLDRARVEIHEPSDSKSDHLAAYAGVDIALDPFPYHGTTTTCEALWMGVPVVTLAGDRHASRVGMSLLTAVGLTELIADSPARYERIATELARSPDRLALWRAGLRGKVAASPLCDAAGFARRFECVLRDAWITKVRP
ncbi:MAG: hypothetical protein ACKVW3_17485 [Phycisphaerales bacterium]